MKKIPQAQLTEDRVRVIVKEEMSFFEKRFEMKIQKMFDKQNDFISNLLDGFILEAQDMRMEHATQTQRIPALVDEVAHHEDRLNRIEKKIFA